MARGRETVPLTGGAAILIEPNTTRFSNDLDYFHDSEQRVAEAFSSDRKLLEAHRYSVSVDLNRPGYVRAIVRRDGQSTKVEWAHDSSWRFLPTVRHERFGFVLHPIDLAVNKVLALAGRDEPRDLLDALYQHREILPLGATCWAACGKDPASRRCRCWSCCVGVGGFAKKISLDWRWQGRST